MDTIAMVFASCDKGTASIAGEAIGAIGLSGADWSDGALITFVSKYLDKLLQLYPLSTTYFDVSYPLALTERFKIS